MDRNRVSILIQIKSQAQGPYYVNLCSALSCRWGGGRGGGGERGGEVERGGGGGGEGGRGRGEGGKGRGRGWGLLASRHCLIRSNTAAALLNKPHDHVGIQLQIEMDFRQEMYLAEQKLKEPKYFYWRKVRQNVSYFVIFLFLGWISAGICHFPCF